MSIPTRHTRPRRSPASTWPAWTDEVRWTLGPSSPDCDDPGEEPAGRLVCSCGRVLIEYDSPGPDQVAEAACNACGAAERAALDRSTPIPVGPSPEAGSPPF
jgi:hypothetical protein